MDLGTPECEDGVQQIIHLQAIANRLYDASNDTVKVTKSHIMAFNTPAWIVVPEEQHEKIEQFGPRLKRGRPVRSNDVVPKKKD